MAPPHSRWLQNPTLTRILCLLSAFSFTAGLLLWYPINSDRDYLHPLLTQLIPAGHAACETATVFECSSCLTCSHQTISSLTPSPDTWEFEYTRDGHNAGLSREQCSAAFPGLFEDIARATSYWRIKHRGLSLSDLDTITLNPGMARARIAHGELYVLATNARKEDHRRKIVAALSSIHRALVTDTQRTSVPEIEFVFSIEDKLSDVSGPHDPVWTLARTAEEEAAWLMPDFGFWAWDHAHTEIGPFDAVVEDAVEYDRLPWSEKTQQLVWRGKPSFAPKLRRALLDKTRGREWADVQAVDWHGNGGNVLGLGEHCRYIYIAHVEGRSYSASLKYRQACRSVIVAHQLQYIQHHHYLLVSSGPEQNYVEVSRDFSDLEEKILSLLADPEEAQRIADNSVRTFRERYLTAAAEGCYWRRLWDGYAAVFNGSTAQSNGGRGGKRRGMRYESFILQGSERMMKFDAFDALTSLVTE
ncbi:hypothetical protein BDV12DRAFT_71443 [Aspergillus spectabilis]